jgi:PAS domain S-box-containing protein
LYAPADPTGNWPGNDKQARGEDTLAEEGLSEQMLHESEELYRTVVERATENIFFVDVATKQIVGANGAFHHSLGYASQKLSRISLYDVVADQDRDEVDRTVRHILKEGHCFLGESQHRRKDGSLIDVEVSASAVSYSGGRAICVAAHDITQRKRAEEDLRQSLDVLLALREAGQTLGSTLESEEVVTRLLKIMCRVSGLTAAVISALDERGQFRVWRAVGLEKLWPRTRYSPDAEATRRAVLETGERRLFKLRWSDPEGRRLKGLCLPLRVRGRIAGVLEAYGPPSLAEIEAVEILSSLAAQANSALENALLYEELTEREKRLEDLIGRLFATQEEERRRVAREVHDGLTQMATAAHQHLQAFARFHPPSSEDGQQILDQALELVQRTVSEARQVIANLRPTVLDDFGLKKAIYLEAEALRAEGWSLVCEGNMREDERLPTAIETAVFRIVQEALTNVRRHAATQRVSLSLDHLGQKVRLTIRDWGRGFDPAAPRDNGGRGEGVGLSSMQERVALLGGTFHVESYLGVGTLLRIDIPLQEGNSVAKESSSVGSYDAVSSVPDKQDLMWSTGK